MTAMFGLSTTKPSGKIVVLQQIEIIMLIRIVKCAMGVRVNISQSNPTVSSRPSRSSGNHKLFLP